jgi:hypothetical protein
MVLERGRHRAATHAVGRIQATTCTDCATVEWSADDVCLEPWEALEEVIGQLRVLSRLPGIGSPGPYVFVSAPPRAGSRLLGIFTKGRWWEIAPGLCATTDGARLLLSPVDPTLGANLFATLGR